jgi:CheY-like chemotaxis protein
MTTLGRILLVEDNLKDIELTIAALEEHNLANEVVVARNGVEALDYLYSRGKFADRDAGHPAVTLLDIKMPKMSGLEVLRHLKSDPQMRSLPVVMLTSSREEPDLLESYDLGANAYVVKPESAAGFIRTVRAVCEFWLEIAVLPRR